MPLILVRWPLSNRRGRRLSTGISSTVELTSDTTTRRGTQKKANMSHKETTSKAADNTIDTTVDRKYSVSEKHTAPGELLLLCRFQLGIGFLELRLQLSDFRSCCIHDSAEISPRKACCN